ncbi:MAG: hypothetical protein GF308_16695 [Candidatus Heimdallarchaeota archaeon]|nr:hypothetical protein [Candidatus Heimdallarchaeota archaeon]
MIKVHITGLKRFLDFLEEIVETNQALPQEAIDRVLMDEPLAFMQKAYSNMLDFSREEFAMVIAHLAEPEPVGKGKIVSKLEEGFRSCLNREKINSLKEKLSKIEQVDFTKAEHIALSYLPPKTVINSNIYLTIDTVNPGMIQQNDISLSILAMDPEEINFNYLAHEFHHAGFEYWNKKQGLDLIEKDTHEGIAIKLLLSLIAEGLANFFCTPEMIYREPNSKGYKRIKEYEQELKQLLKEIQKLFTDCFSKRDAIEICKKRLEKIIFDPECVLPPIHFIGAKMIEKFDKHPAIEKAEIINLCKKPIGFFSLYQKIAPENNLPNFSNEVTQQFTNILHK